MRPARYFSIIQLSNSRAAREYTEEWVWKYLEYIDEIPRSTE